MYDKLRTMQKMLRDKILEVEKLERKYNRVVKKNDSLVSEKESLQRAFDITQQENVNLKNEDDQLISNFLLFYFHLFYKGQQLSFPQ